MKTYIVVDIESNGPIPGDYSMTQLGAVIADKNLDKTFKVNIKPISDKYIADRIDESHLVEAVEAKTAMNNFNDWIKANAKGKAVFVSDNNGFDWMFVCWYFWHFIGKNPFGYNSTNINSLFKGLKKNLDINIGDLRKNPLSHDALEDAICNARVFLDVI